MPQASGGRLRRQAWYFAAMTEAALAEETPRQLYTRQLREGLAPVSAFNGAANLLLQEWPETDAALSADELLAERMLDKPISPLRLERRLTETRRRMLRSGASPEADPFLARLAIQGGLNEFVWDVSPADEATVEGMAGRLDSLTPSEVMLVAAHRPLAGVLGADDLAARLTEGPVAEVLREHVLAVRKEQALQARIPALTPIRPGVSEAVQGQYEVSPYPRWRRVIPLTPRRSVFGWRVPDRSNVLIAGCGTGQHAAHSGQRYANARVLGVDLSRASLGYGLRMVREAGITNIAFAQADLLELGRTSLEFEIVECSGVLHHLDDPFEGARAICGRLRKGGLLKLGLYSARARAFLKPAKALAAEYGPNAIRELRQAIIARPNGDPVRAVTTSADFYARSSCRDLLMHVQEHELEVADLKRMLAENGMTFLAFQVDTSVHSAFAEMFPEPDAARDLDRWADFEAANPGTFTSMYQFWAVKTG